MLNGEKLQVFLKELCAIKYYTPIFKIAALL